MLATISWEGREFSMDLDPDFQADTHIIKHGPLYEPEIGAVIQKVLQPGDIAVDVGANVGFFTCMMASLVGPQGRVFAFEPDPDNVLKLRRNIELNSFYRVEVIEQPVWSSTARLLFYHNFDDSSGSAVWNPGVWYGNSKTRCAHAGGDDGTEWRGTVTLDEWTPRLPKLLKVDVEGAELQVLKGATRLLSECPYIICELNPFGLRQVGDSLESLRTFMSDRHMYLLHKDATVHVKPSARLVLQDDVISNALFTLGEWR